MILGQRNTDFSQRANSDLPDKVIMDLWKDLVTDGTFDKEFLGLFGEDKDEPTIEKIIRKYYVSGSGLYEEGLNDEAKLGDIEIADDEKKISVRSFSRKFHITRSVLEYGESNNKEFDKFKISIKEALITFFDNVSQEAADIAFLRGWETSFKSNFDTVTGDNSMVDNRDLEGSNPRYAKEHKVISSSPNAYRWNNLCVDTITDPTKVVFNPELSKNSIISTYQYAQTRRDYSGRLIKGKNVNTIICSIEKHQELLQLFGSTHEVHSANNGIETFKSLIPGVSYTTWNRLRMDGEGNIKNPDSDTSYTDFWFLVDMNGVKDELRYHFHRLPTINKIGNADTTESETYFIRSKFLMYTIPQGNIFGSNATSVEEDIANLK